MDKKIHDKNSAKKIHLKNQCTKKSAQKIMHDKKICEKNVCTKEIR